MQCFVAPEFRLNDGVAREYANGFLTLVHQFDFVVGTEPHYFPGGFVLQDHDAFLFTHVLNGDDREFGKNRTLSFASSCNQFIVFSMDERKWRKLFDKQIAIL